MRLEFKIEINNDDYIDLKNRNQINNGLWTHYDALDYLDILDYPSTYTEEYKKDKYSVELVASYQIDEHILDMLLLKWPKLLLPVRNYEKIVLRDF